jgi:hypothetical protein
MSSNPYFNNIYNASEKDLIDDLVVEAIQIKGIDVYYIPRTLVKENTILGEDILESFETKFQIEIWVKTVDGFGGEGSFMKKFGLEIRDQAHLIMSQSRFNKVMGDDYLRPREGDLIFFPITNSLWEIRYIDNEEIFYQLGQLTVFDLTVERFEYTHQSFETGIPEIDDIEDSNVFVINLNMQGGSGIDYEVDETVYQGDSLSAATATGTVVSWTTTGDILRIKDITGTFANGEIVYGNTSGADAELLSYDDNEMPTDTGSDNEEIEDGSEDIDEWNSSDPFGES